MNILRLISFNGYAYSDNVVEHKRVLEVAKRLNKTSFAHTVAHTELPEPNEDGKLDTRHYYRLDRAVVTEKEYGILKSAGVEVTVAQMMNREIIPMQKVTFVTILLTFIAWNITLLLKLAGVI